MCMRATRGVKIFFEGELCAEMSSIRSTADLLMLHDPKGRSFSAIKNMLYRACKNGSEMFGFTFEKDVNWKVSRPVRETNILTGETLVLDSVNKMGSRVFGGACSSAASMISSLCKSGRECNGFKYEYVNEDCNKWPSNTKGRRKRKAVLQIKDGVTLNMFSSVTNAGKHILESGESASKSLIAITNRISACANGDRDFVRYLGYTWKYV